MKSFCTIITPNYLAYALALRESVFAFEVELDFFICLSENDKKIKQATEQTYARTYVLMPSDFSKLPLAEQLRTKYAAADVDAYRWSMKPLLMRYLLESGYSSCIYTDCDIHFYSSPLFLFDLLKTHSILLSPHNRSMYPNEDPANFEKNFTEGVFNGGFVGANKNGIAALDWWLKACLYKCEKDIANGFYDDQKYLDMMAAKFENVYALKHPGCNLAEWNLTDCKRTETNGLVFINNTYSVVFIHFSGGYPMEICFVDALLKPHFLTYANRVKKYNSAIDLEQQANANHVLWLNHKQQVKASVTGNSIPQQESRLKRWLKKIR